MIYFIIAVIAIILIYVLIQYNSLVKSRNYVKEAFSTMDVYLKKRWDLVPNLVEVVKQYSRYESETLKEITKLRISGYDNMSMNKKLNINEKITQDLSNIMAISENYPELKANENYIQLSKELVKIEDDIANSRKYYNGTVRTFNNKIQMFPGNIVAKIFGFKSEEMFEANAGEKSNVNVEL